MAAKQPPPLMKKHSQTDLVSRLKTRKILGVGGEDDDGEVHRSKISQVLGNEIKFAVREPLGLRVWQLVSAVMFSGVAVMVSEGCCPGKNQLLTAKEVPQHGPSVPGISLPPLPPAAPTARPLPSLCLSNGLCQQCPWQFVPIASLFSLAGPINQGMAALVTKSSHAADS
uniref:Tumor protein p53-inducible protein 11 n=1 Tax=Serinus canaria TaxID=9135 RepID=A0A8C9MJF4_SERCA